MTGRILPILLPRRFPWSSGSTLSVLRLWIGGLPWVLLKLHHFRRTIRCFRADWRWRVNKMLWTRWDWVLVCMVATFGRKFSRWWRDWTEPINLLHLLQQEPISHLVFRWFCCLLRLLPSCVCPSTWQTGIVLDLVRIRKWGLWSWGTPFLEACWGYAVIHGWDGGLNHYGYWLWSERRLCWLCDNRKLLWHRVAEVAKVCLRWVKWWWRFVFLLCKTAGSRVLQTPTRVGRCPSIIRVLVFIYFF